MSLNKVRSRKETAAIIGVSLRTLARLEQMGEAPPRIAISMRLIGYRDSDIDAWLMARRGSPGEALKQPSLDPGGTLRQSKTDGKGAKPPVLA